MLSEGKLNTIEKTAKQLAKMTTGKLQHFVIVESLGNNKAIAKSYSSDEDETSFNVTITKDRLYNVYHFFYENDEVATLKELVR